MNPTLKQAMANATYILQQVVLTAVMFIIAQQVLT